MTDTPEEGEEEDKGDKSMSYKDSEGSQWRGTQTDRTLLYKQSPIFNEAFS